jgi:tRNA-splicing ligase RtcB
MPVWCGFRDAARAEHNAREAAALAVTLPPQAEAFQNAPLKVFGEHDEATLAQMRNCMGVGNVVAGVVCADGHLGYAQPVGGVIAYEKQISISGVGFDIGCGNMAVRLDTPFSEIADRIGPLIKDVAKVISFGVGRTNDERVEAPLFDDAEAWRESDMQDYRAKAVTQLGTVGSGNHYVDLMRDEAGFVWIGVHFGSRGLGHTSATKYLKAAGGQDGMNVPPAVIDEDSELGRRYIAAMELAGRYSYAGREWVIERVRKMIGGTVTDMVHNHHNYAWRENHGGRDLWVVRKGATPAFPGQRGFVGGSMGDDAVIIEGVDSPEAKASLYSTVHGAGRLFGRKEAKRRFTKVEMDAWLQERGVTLVGADLDESPMAYRRLPDVLAHHAKSIRVLHTLRPFGVAMAGGGEFDPWKD